MTSYIIVLVVGRVLLSLLENVVVTNRGWKRIAFVLTLLCDMYVTVDVHMSVLTIAVTV